MKLPVSDEARRMNERLVELNEFLKGLRAAVDVAASPDPGEVEAAINERAELLARLNELDV